MFGKKGDSQATRMIAFAIFDQKAHAYNPPYFLPHVDIAIRGFAQSVRSPDRYPTMNMFPEDYSLYEVGEFDDKEGKLISLPEPKFVCRGSDLVKSLSPVGDLSNVSPAGGIKL